MIVLGIDTSDYANTLGVVDDAGVLSGLEHPARSNSIESIITDIEGVLKKANISLNDIQGIGVGLGPGSWTGIRIGVTVGKMLAFSTGKPVAGISTLKALAYGIDGKGRTIFSVIDVGTKDTVYAAQYRNENGHLEQTGDYYVGDIKGFGVLIKGPAIMVGAGAVLYAMTLRDETGIEIQAIEARPSGTAIASLAAQRLSRGERDDVLALTPLYLKESTAKAFVNKYRAGKT